MAKLRLSKTKSYIIAVAVIVIAVVGFWLSRLNSRRIEVGENENRIVWPTGSLRGEECENAESRPIAVMMASDPIARPLSGISQADIVVEMPVTPNGITRLMAIFQCNRPEEIGSIRSARDDFLPIVKSFGAIYSHWGGEREALEKLDRGILDNIDALKNRYNEYFRKSGVRAPHNGFTSYSRLENAAEKYSYSLADLFEGYPRKSGEEKKNLSQLTDEISVGYETSYNVSWQYNLATNTYKRFRNNLPETDKINGEQVEFKNIIIINAPASFLRDQYISVGVIGTGEARIFKNGIIKNARWSKADFSGKLYFYEQDNKEIEFEPGSIWIHYIAAAK